MSETVKQFVVLRRRAGQTIKAFHNYHYQQHGSVSQASDPKETPLVYYQTHIFDSVYSNNSLAQPWYTGHNDSTELYFADAEHAQHFDLPIAMSGEKDVGGYIRFKDIFVPLCDNVKLAADIFLPTSSVNIKVPVLTSLGPYGKDVNSAVFGLPKTDIYANMYKNIKPGGEDSVFEVVHPLTWVSQIPRREVSPLFIMVRERNVSVAVK